MYCAPIEAHARACATEYTAVTSTVAPSRTRADAAAKPAAVAGTFTATRSPSARMPSALRRKDAVSPPQVWKKISRAPSDSHRA